MNAAAAHSGQISIFDSIESNVRSYCRNFPVVFTKAHGATLTDHTGKEYLDFFSGAGALNYGHNNPHLQAPLIDYIRSDGITHSLDLHTSAKASFLEAFQRHILRPRGMDHKVQFTGPTGTNAVEAALKLARKVTGRSNVVAFTNAFHGMSLGALAATTNPTKRAGAGTALGGVTFMPYDGYHGPDVDAFQIMQRMLARGAGVDMPAAFLVECVQGEGGLRSASAQWLQKVLALAHSIGALLIIDDIQAGCGRCGEFFGFEALDVTPDIVCLSKSLSGYGLPMSINLIRPHLDIWEPGEHNGTFRGNNLAFVTARAAIQTYWSNPAFGEELAEKAEVLDIRLHTLRQTVYERSGLNASLPGRGLMRGIDLGDGKIAAAVSARAFKLGLLIETCGVREQVLKLMPPLTITPEALGNGLAILEAAILAALTQPTLEVV